MNDAAGSQWTFACSTRLRGSGAYVDGGLGFLTGSGVLLDHLTCAFQADIGWEYVAWVAFGLAAHGVGEGYQTGCKLHLHHWYWAFLACHYAVFDCLLSRFAQAAFLGIYIHGAALFGLESIYEPSKEIAARPSADKKRTQLSMPFFVDTLVLNAGVMRRSRLLTEDGLEETMAANHLGHFLLDVCRGDIMVAYPAEVH
ncbi:hypothetical protein AK812_SmicGene28989 [Symbiodinium microadriaticum]|uniref:Uncharacterized protein n=1 Tax=Symbiodinium microadriaticum TaxID=2951 RepID=A0A1Q9D2Y9_SYMMI|nr:hypothetical protein AK812_SmicGene28989 [Symbiodinium microadriaticum]